MLVQALKGRNNVMPPFQGSYASGRINTQGYALGCCSVPFQGKENALRIG